MQADGYSLDDKRDKIEGSDLPDIVEKWNNRGLASTSSANSDRKKKCFFVPVGEIVENNYDLSINRYKEIVYEEVKYDPPKVILGRIEGIETEIVGELSELKKMVGK